MTEIAGLTYYELDFNADGTLSSDGGLPAAVQAGGIQDVYVLSHGWNNGVDSARNLYQAMFTLLAGMIPDKLGSSCAVGIIWPSLLFPNDDPATAQQIPSTGQQIAAAIAPAFPAQQQNIATLGQLLDQRPQDPAALQQFHTLASSLVTTPRSRPRTPARRPPSPATPRPCSATPPPCRRRPGPARRACRTRSAACGTAPKRCCAACPTTR